MTLSFAILAVLGSQPKMVFAVPVLLLIAVIHGLFDTAWHLIGSPDDYGNPYLRDNHTWFGSVG